MRVSRRLSELETRIYAFARDMMYHNFVKISGAHSTTRAMKASVDKSPWEISDIVKVVEG